MRKLFAIVLGLGLLQVSTQAGVDANGNKTPDATTEETGVHQLDHARTRRRFLQW